MQTDKPQGNEENIFNLTTKHCNLRKRKKIDKKQAI